MSLIGFNIGDLNGKVPLTSGQRPCSTNPESTKYCEQFTFPCVGKSALFEPRGYRGIKISVQKYQYKIRNYSQYKTSGMYVTPERVSQVNQKQHCSS